MDNRLGINLTKEQHEELEACAKGKGRLGPGMAFAIQETDTHRVIHMVRFQTVSLPKDANLVFPPPHPVTDVRLLLLVESMQQAGSSQNSPEEPEE